jgi:hypothetical protein
MNRSNQLAGQATSHLSVASEACRWANTMTDTAAVAAPAVSFCEKNQMPQTRKGHGDADDYWVGQRGERPPHRFGEMPQATKAKKSATRKEFEAMRWCVHLFCSHTYSPVSFFYPFSVVRIAGSPHICVPLLSFRFPLLCFYPFIPALEQTLPIHA